MRNKSQKNKRLSLRSRSLLLQPNRLLQRLYPKALWRFNTTQKFICLTFDDGPIELTNWVLDELAKYQAKASFFCVGDNVIKHPGIFERISREGHLLANHTQHHVKGFKLNTSDYLVDVASCADLVPGKYFRPPYGQLKASQYRALKGLGYTLVMWDVISYDYEQIEPEACLKNVLKHAREGSIVLFHDNTKAETNLRYTLPEVLRHFSAQNFQFIRLDSAESLISL